MYYSICEHPLRLKIDGSYRYVPCGKCNTCRNRHSSEWVSRLESEFRCHKYAAFITLTYNDSFVPRLYLDYSSGEYSLLDTDTGESFSCSDIPGFKPNSRLYLAKRKNIPYARVSDFQKFMKRLRFYCSNFLLHTYDGRHFTANTLRYFAVSEYGPTSFRPHWHAIIFFSSQALAGRFFEFVDKSWRFGITDKKYCDSGTAQYVAKYVNSVSALPKIYSHKSLRPVCLSSKFPAIGTLSVPQSYEETLFFEGYSELARERSSGEIQDVPVWKTLENRLFPKVQGFNNLTHSERVTLYSVSRLCPVDGFQNFVEWCRELRRLPYSTWLSNYLSVLLTNDEKNHLYDNSYCSLKSLYYTSVRVCTQKMVITSYPMFQDLDWYVSRIENYYSKKELFKLKKFYEFQEKFAIENQTTLPFLFLYSDSFYQFEKLMDSQFDVNVLSPGYFYFLTSIGFNMRGDPLDWSVRYGFAQTFKYRSDDGMINLNASIVNRSRKKRKKNDYALSHKDDFDFNILKNYE